LKHGGGGDSNAIANMVSYTLKKYNADPKKVFVTGSSSGAMMTVSYPSFRVSCVEVSHLREPVKNHNLSSKKAVPTERYEIFCSP
jgi:predicted peptidase